MRTYRKQKMDRDGFYDLWDDVVNAADALYKTKAVPLEKLDDLMQARQLLQRRLPS